MRYLTVDLETAAIDDATTYIEPVSAPSNYKDEQKIAQYILEKTAEAAGRCSLDPDLCRIVALGWDRGRGPVVMTAQNEKEERTALLAFWSHVDRDTTLVTYNGVAFDIPVLLRRSLYLSVPAPAIQVDKYRHPQIVDLMQLLSFNGMLRYHGLNFYTQRFGLPVIDEDAVSGADIYQLMADGDWGAIAGHCRADVMRTTNLARRIGAVPELVAVA